MGNFWPSGIELSDTQSPKQILEVAQEDWCTSSNGVMELILQDRETESGNPMIVVHAKHVPSNRTAALFSIVHRPGNPYPATIQPKDEKLPNFLKKSYHHRPATLFSVTEELINPQGRTISNQWVSETPAEFREKLAEAFNLGTIKATMVHLASQASDDESEANAESQEE
ncbi:MAG: hypothetical protein WBA57_18975 [Elainellaceae cyanobacterium]